MANYYVFDNPVGEREDWEDLRACCRTRDVWKQPDITLRGVQNRFRMEKVPEVDFQTVIRGGNGRPICS